jgi:hypothetical protein
LERKYCRAATEADRLLREPMFKEGNRAGLDPYKVAKRQFVLGQVVHKRDRWEAKYSAWQEFAEKFGRFVAGVRNWKGKKLPYTFGVLDVSFVLYLIDYLGFGEFVSARSLVQAVRALIAN